MSENNVAICELMETKQFRADTETRKMQIWFERN